MFRIIFTSILVIGFTCCKKKETIPVTEIAKYKPIIKDMFIAEAALTKAHVSVRDSLARLYKAQILEIHEISEKELDEWMKKVKANPKTYAAINKSVSEELNSDNK